jgi:hypothetical protein
MGQLDSNVQSPTVRDGADRRRRRGRGRQRGAYLVAGRLPDLQHERPRKVALQVAFERQILKPVFLVDRQ